MRTLTWAVIMFMSPFTMKGLVVMTPLFALVAYTRWTVLCAVVIVGSMVSLAAAEELHDERQPMDVDTCNEHQGDVMEHYYQVDKGWRITKQTDDEWIKVKGNMEVHFRCEHGLSIIETKPAEVKPSGQVDYMK